MAFFSNRRSNDTTAPTVSDPIKPATTSRSPIGFETIMGTKCTIEGTLRSDSNIRLDGDFTGTLEITGNVLVGETAKINADINARNISIAGTVRGNVTGKKVQLLRTARVWGDITATAFATEEGAFIDGKISMTSDAASDDTITVTSAPIEDTVEATIKQDDGNDHNADTPTAKEHGNDDD